MRVALAVRWPDLSHLFGLHPWDVDRLTPLELRAYVAWLDAYIAQRKKEARRG